LISRRVVIAVLTTFESYDSTTFNVVLIVLILLYFRAHMLYFPFLDDEVNFMEGLCLFALLAVMVGVNLIGNLASSSFSNSFVRVYVAVLIIIPLAIFAYMIFFNSYTRKDKHPFAAPRDEDLLAILEEELMATHRGPIDTDQPGKQTGETEMIAVDGDNTTGDNAPGVIAAGENTAEVNQPEDNQPENNLPENSPETSEDNILGMDKETAV